MWTEEDEERLRALLGEGKTFSGCAAQLPGKTRNACIGKAHRLKIASRPVPRPAKPRVRREAKPRPPKSFAPRVRPSSGIRPPSRDARLDDRRAAAGRKTFADLLDGECRDLDDDGTYCAAPCEGRGSYCRHHARMVYRPRDPNGRTRASA